MKFINGMVQKNSSFNDKIQYVICGFDTRGSITEINKETGEQKCKVTGEQKNKETGEKKSKETGEYKSKETGQQKSKETMSQVAFSSGIRTYTFSSLSLSPGILSKLR